MGFSGRKQTYKLATNLGAHESFGLRLLQQEVRAYAMLGSQIGMLLNLSLLHTNIRTFETWHMQL